MTGRTYFRPLFGVSAIALTLVACGTSSSPSDPGITEEEITTDQASDDVTVLKVERAGGEIAIQDGASITRGARPSAPGFDASKCKRLGEGRLDCTKEFESAFGLRALGNIVVAESAALCTVLKITTVSKAAAIAGADGIGSFYSTDNIRQNTGRLIAKADLKSAGTATLKNGESAELHEFGGLGVCDIGGRFGTSTFKPYMRFTNGSAKYRNWDATPITTVFSNGNYGVDWRTAFDRSADLLR